jgi:hypothetical protein
MTPAAITQSSPITKSYQKAPNARSRAATADLITCDRPTGDPPFMSVHSPTHRGRASGRRNLIRT